ncbi:uracil-DNA glycosylase family protein [Sphingomonas sp. LT1P40]|uniref:uracil-DNA glycosylase family protein n=1 Tax=Alteristakelama amylovorans TaxID=3096166 RepID=UPI002FCC0DB8
MDWREATISALDWWQEAGVDTLVDELPRDWSAREAASAVPGAVPPPPLVEVEAPLPVTLEAFVDWRFGGHAPESSWGEPILLPMGNPAAPLMVMTDLPEPTDAEAASLLTGPSGRLLDRILAAICYSRDSVYLTSLCAARPVTGQVPRDAEPRLAELARHHIALTAPKQLLLLGQTVSRAILGAESASGRERLHKVNYEGGQSAAVTVRHPRFLIDKPAAKADAWKNLQLLIGGQDT